MTDWTQMEQGAIGNFLASPGPLRTGLEKFTAHMSQENKASCAAAMSTVPRNPELAADHAAKAQMLDEFWTYLEDTLRQAAAVPAPAEEQVL